MVYFFCRFIQWIYPKKASGLKFKFVICLQKNLYHISGPENEDVRSLPCHICFFQAILSQPIICPATPVHLVNQEHVRQRDRCDKHKQQSWMQYPGAQVRQGKIQGCQTCQSQQRVRRCSADIIFPAKRFPGLTEETDLIHTGTQRVPSGKVN